MYFRKAYFHRQLFFIALYDFLKPCIQWFSCQNSLDANLIMTLIMSVCVYDTHLPWPQVAQLYSLVKLSTSQTWKSPQENIIGIWILYIKGKEFIFREERFWQQRYIKILYLVWHVGQRKSDWRTIFSVTIFYIFKSTWKSLGLS